MKTVIQSIAENNTKFLVMAFLSICFLLGGCEDNNDNANYPEEYKSAQLPEIAGRYALRLTHGDSEVETLSFVLLEQQGFALTIRDESSGSEIGVGTVNYEGEVTIHWLNDTATRRVGHINHVTSSSVPFLADAWSIEGNFEDFNPQGVTAWRLERMDDQFQVFLESYFEEEDLIQGNISGATHWLTADAPGDGHQQIINAGTLPIESSENRATGEATKAESKTPQGDVLECNSTPWSERIVANLQEGKLVAADPQVIFPGSVLQGLPLKTDGDLEPVSIARSGGTLFLTGLILEPGAKYSRLVDEVNAAQTNQAINELLTDNVVQGTSAGFVFNSRQVYSYDQLLLTLGVDKRFGNDDLSGSLKIDASTTTTRTKNYFLATFIQTFYTVTFQRPVLAEDFFRDGGSFSDPDNVIHPGNPPLYISSVNYGRQAFFLIESDQSEETISATLNAALDQKAEGDKVTVNSNLTYKDVLKSAKVTYWVRGGASDLAVQPIAEAGIHPDNMYLAFKQFLSNPGAANFSPANPGVPVSYTVKYLMNDKVVAMNMSAVYDKVDCHVASSGTHKWEFHYEDMNYRTTLWVDGQETHTRNSGAGKLGGDKWDFSVNDADDHTLRFQLSNGDCGSSSGDFSINKDGIRQWHYRYDHGFDLTCWDEMLDVSFLFNNRAGGILREDSCRVRSGVSFDTKEKCGKTELSAAPDLGAARAYPVSLECDVTNGFYFAEDMRTQIGHITSFTIGGLSLVNDINVTDPLAAPNTKQIVGVVEDLDFGGSSTSFLSFTFFVSSENKSKLLQLLETGLTENSVSISFDAYDYDPIAKEYFNEFSSADKVLKGSIWQSDGENPIWISEVPSAVVVSPKNFKVSIRIIPAAGEAQSIHTASSVATEGEISWGPLSQ